MGKAPAFQFYPGDWMQDTRALSLSAKGAWIDLLCAMWRSQTRGQLSLPILGYARLIGATVEQTKAVIDELTEMHVCDSNVTCNANVTDGNRLVTLINRRMIREEKERKSTCLRVQKFRNKECNAFETPLKQATSSSSSKGRVYKGGSSSIGDNNKSEIEPKKSEPTPPQEKTAKEILSIADKLFTQKIFPKVIVFINTAKKEGKSLSVIKHALYKCLIEKPRPPDPWGFCQKIVNEDNQKFKHQENNNMWLGLVDRLKQISAKQEL